MEGSPVAYALPVLAVLVLAAASTVVVRVGQGAYRLALTYVSSPVPRERQVVRRCERCGRGWRSDGRLQPTLLGLYVRRAVRRRLREREREAPEWARAQGRWRCPSCLSRRVRTSGEPALPPPALRPGTRLLALGVAAAVVGLLLLGAAALVVVTGGTA